jgi:2,3-bisphosphoglycerate-dependent phosphoglycerate mutase
MKKDKKKVYRIYVFRHGKTKYNQKGIFTGWKDPSITFWGRMNARKIAKILKDKEINIAIETKLVRSKETLKIVLKYHPECKKIIEDNRMIERSYGDLEGTKHKDFIKRIGKQLVNLESEGDFIASLNEHERKKIAKFLGEEEYKAIHRGYDIAAPNGESFLDVEKRVQSFILWLKGYIKKNKVNVAISAHGNSIRLFRKIMENASREDVVNWIIPYDKVFEYEVKV